MIKPFDAMGALQAAKARLAEQLDSIPLRAFGPVSADIRADLLPMIDSAIAAVNVEAINAACLWEAVIDARAALYSGEGGDGARPAWVAAMNDYFDGFGSCEARDSIVALSGFAESGWRAAQETGFDSPFDWEFCPWFIAACLDWGTGGPGIRADYLDKCRAMGAADGKQCGAAIGALDAINTTKTEG